MQRVAVQGWPLLLLAAALLASFPRAVFGDDVQQQESQKETCDKLAQPFLDKMAVAEECLFHGHPLFPLGVSVHGRSIEEARSVGRSLAGSRYFLPTEGQADGEIERFFQVREELTNYGQDPHFGNLRLALWGLLEYSGYEALKPFGKDAAVKCGFSFQAPRSKKIEILEEPPALSKSYSAFLYSFMVLGQRAIPTESPNVRRRLEEIVFEAVDTRRGLFTPLLAIALGQTILEETRMITRASKPFTLYLPFSRFMRSIYRHTYRYHVTKRELVVFLKHMHNQLENGADLVVLSDLAYSVYAEYRMVAASAYKTLLMANLRFKWYDPYHFLPEAKFHQKQSRFIKTMSYFGRLFVRAGNRALQQAQDVLAPDFERDEHGDSLLPNDLVNSYLTKVSGSQHWNWFAKWWHKPGRNWLPRKLDEKRFGKNVMPGVFSSESSDM